MRDKASSGNWINVCLQTDLLPGSGKLIDQNGLKIAIYNLNGEYFALEDLCTHDHFPMLGCGLPQDMVIHGDQITCPRHGARFSIRSGATLCPPAYEPLHSFPVRIADGMIQVQAANDG